MQLQWNLIVKCAWTIFWVTAVYSYVTCGIVGVITGVRTKGDHAEIDRRVDAFIISPLYVATFFSLFAMLFIARTSSVLAAAPLGMRVVNMLLVGGAVFAGHTLLELLEATVIRRDPLRMLNDRDAIRLSGVYLVIILLGTGIGALFA